MNARKIKQIESQLEKLDERLANAEEYVARGINIEGDSWLHFGDWSGKSGHPLWMRNVMIPRTLKHRTRKERAIEKIGSKEKDKRVSNRKRREKR